MTEDQVKIRFYIPRGKNEITVCDSLNQAYEICRNHGLLVDWIFEDDLVNIFKLQRIQDLPEVVVLDHLSSGSTVENLLQLCREGILTLVGPQCLLMCLQRNCPIPDTRHPVISGALRGCVVTSSGVSNVEDRQRLRGLVQRMWGEWSDSLHDGVTHLVAATVLSDKYRAAVGAGVPVMAVSWLEEVWRAAVSGADGAVSGVEPRFSGHKCPPLLGVRVSVSQLERADRDLISRSVEAGGGEYSGVLDTECSVLVCLTSRGDKEPYINNVILIIFSRHKIKPER